LRLAAGADVLVGAQDLTPVALFDVIAQDRTGRAGDPAFAGRPIITRAFGFDRQLLMRCAINAPDPPEFDERIRTERFGTRGDELIAPR
jgi:hypothetical protein